MNIFPTIAFTILVLVAVPACSIQTATNLQPTARYDFEETGIRLPAPKAGRDRPVVAILAHNSGAETTDFMVPYGVLSRSGAAQVVALAPESGTVPLFPALQVQIEEDFAGFAASYPEGADVVIVPAFHHPDDEQIIDWLVGQARQGAVVVGICDGVWTLAHAGMLEGRHATGHWFSLNRLADQYPDTRWVSDRRYLADGNVITTSGVSASLPVSLALVEAIAGPELALGIAESLDMSGYSDLHDAREFGLSGGLLAVAVRNTLLFWQHENHPMQLYDGIDEVALALTADAWSRTWRSKAFTVSETPEPVRGAQGLRMVADEWSPAPAPDRDRMLTPSVSLRDNLDNITVHYGARTAEFVAQQLEF